MNIHIARSVACRQNICSGSSCSGGSCSGGGTGAQGLMGAQGLKGEFSYNGPAGDTGAQGFIGATGPSQGPKGDTGSQGSIGDTGPLGGPKGDAGVTGAQGLQGPAGSITGTQRLYIIKVPMGATLGFDFPNGVALTNSTSLTPAAALGTYNGGVNRDSSTFSISLNSRYTIVNMPVFVASAYVYAPNQYTQSGGYINCQRQMGTHTGTSACQITMSSGMTFITFNYLTKVNFPYTTNDSAGFALYIYLQILN